MAAVIGPAAVLFALGGSAHAQGRDGRADAAAEDAAACCHLEVTAAGPMAPSWAASAVQPVGAPAETAASRAARWHVVSKEPPLRC